MFFLSALVCLAEAGCSKEKAASRPGGKTDEIVLVWWETTERKEKNLSAVIVSARIPGEKLYLPSPKNPGSYGWNYQAFKLICPDGSAITADGVRMGYHGDAAPFYKIETYTEDPRSSPLKEKDSVMFLVEKKQVDAGGLKFQVRDLPAIPLTEDKRRGK
jgi:hypothetical protein